MYSHKVMYKNIMDTLDFLSDLELCASSWITGTGPFSAGWRDEISNLSSYCFFDFFPDKIESFNLSSDLKEQLLNLIREIYIFSKNLSKKTIEQDILKDKDWIKLTIKIKQTVAQMKVEYKNVPETDLANYPINNAFADLLRHLEFLSDIVKCRNSWINKESPFSLGSEMEFHLIQTNPFFIIEEKETFNQLGVSA